jgi:hypothetical protein
VGSQSSAYLQFKLKEGREPIIVPKSFELDDAFHAWLQLVPDLDQRDRDALIAKIQDQEELSASLEGWWGALKRARLQSLAMLAVAVAAALVINLAPEAFPGTCAAILIIAPFAATYMCMQAPTLFATFKKKSDPRAEMCYVLIVASFGLLFSLREVHFVSLTPIVPVMVIAGLAVAFTNYRCMKDGAAPGAFIGVVLLSALYAFAAVAVLDSTFDQNRTKRYSSDVVGQHMSNGRRTTYYLRVAPWGPIELERDVSVPSRIYSSTRVGDTICFDLGEGRVNAAWFRVVPCLDPNP